MKNEIKLGGCNRAAFPGAIANLLFLFLVFTAVVGIASVPIIVIAEPIQPAGIAQQNDTDSYHNQTGQTPATKR